MSARTWKILGLAGLAGLTTAGVIAASRRRRSWSEVEPDELRDRLHARLAEAEESEPESTD